MVDVKSKQMGSIGWGMKSAALSLVVMFILSLSVTPVSSFGQGTQSEERALGDNQAFDNNAYLKNDADQALPPAAAMEENSNNDPPGILYEDDFDTYTAGTFPPGWGWIYSGRGLSYARIVSDQSYSPPNSWRLEGRCAWAQVVGRQIPNPPNPSITYDYSSGLPSDEYSRTVAWLQEHPQVWFEVRVRVGDIPPGPWWDTTLAGVAFYKVLPRWGRSYGGVLFSVGGDGVYAGSGGASRPIELHRWYNVRVYADLEARTFSSWIDGEPLAVNAPITAPDYPEFVALTANNMGDYCVAWFDDIKIGYGPMVADTTPPSSRVLPFEGDAYWQVEAPFTVTATASDDMSGVASVELWYRYSLDNWTDEVAWKKHDWQLYGVDTNGADGWSWNFDAPYGYGYYEFYSIAIDRAGNKENESAKQDAASIGQPEASCRVAKELLRVAVIFAEPNDVKHEQICSGCDRIFFQGQAREFQKYFDETSYGATAIIIDLFDNDENWYTLRQGWEYYIYEYGGISIGSENL